MKKKAPSPALPISSVVIGHSGASRTGFTSPVKVTTHCFQAVLKDGTFMPFKAGTLVSVLISAGWEIDCSVHDLESKHYILYTFKGVEVDAVMDLFYILPKDYDPETVKVLYAKCNSRS